MKVKVGEVVYDSESLPIMVILTEKDKENIANMHEDATKYAEFNDDCGWSVEEKQQWMKGIFCISEMYK